jgi:mannosyltransferase
VALRFLTASHLWLDEALAVNIARLPVSRIPNALRHDGSPPLYYLLLHGWMAVFGAGDLAVRAFSGVVATATLPLIWLAGRRIGGRAAATAAVLVLASSPFAVRYATEARMYSLLAFLTVAAVLLALRVLERPSVSRAVELAVVCGLLLLTHYWALYFVAAAGLLFLGRLFRHRDRGSLLACAGVAAGGLFLVPWLPVFTFQLAHTGTPWAGRPTFAVVVDTVRAWAGGATDAGVVLNLLLLALAALAVLGTAVDRRRIQLDLRTRPGVRSIALLSLGTLLLALVAAVASNSAYVVRYTATAFPLFVLVVAFGTLVFADPRIRAGVLAGAVLLGLLAAVYNVGGRRTEAVRVASVLNAQARPGDVVAYCPDQLGPSVSRLVTAHVDQLTFPRGTSPRFVDWVDYATTNRAASTRPFAAMLDARAGSHRLWLVWSPNYRTFGTKCSLLAGRLQRVRPTMKRVVKVNPHYEEQMGLIRYEPG